MKGYFPVWLCGPGPFPHRGNRGEMARLLTELVETAVLVCGVLQCWHLTTREIRFLVNDLGFVNCNSLGALLYRRCQSVHLTSVLTGGHYCTVLTTLLSRREVLGTEDPALKCSM